MLDLDSIVLDLGKHATPDDGMCVMEAAALYASEDFTDAPECVSPVIRAFCVSWNDAIPDAETRTRLLRPFIPKVIGTNTGREDDERRAWMACDWLVRTFTPAWLRRARLDAEAAALEALPELTATELVDAALPTIREARERAAAAWAAAWAAGDAARAAAWAAAWAAGDAAGAAAWDAARAAARAAAWDAAGAAAWDAAWDAAWAAAWAAAWDAAGAALADTVDELQRSACELLDRMCAVGRQ
jgi:hypothetical protein